MQNLTLVAAPAAEPISTAEAKTHMRVDDSNSDTLIGLYITAGRRVTEELYGLALVTQTWDLEMDRFPAADRTNPYAAIEPPRPPLQSVTSIGYTDTNGASQTFSSSKYVVQDTSRAQKGRIVPAYGEAWPATRDIVGTVTVRYVAGYGLAAAVPEDIKTALKFLVAHWFENREPVSLAGRPETMPFTFSALLSSYKQHGF